MRCPFCRHKGNRVVDSRMSGDGATIRRRRVCSACKKRFTTYERVEEAAPMVVKKDGRREPFDRAKIIAGIKRACEKRPVSMETIESIADRVESSALERGEREIASTGIVLARPRQERRSGSRIRSQIIEGMMFTPSLLFCPSPAFSRGRGRLACRSLFSSRRTCQPGEGAAGATNLAP